MVHDSLWREAILKGSVYYCSIKEAIKSVFHQRIFLRETTFFLCRYHLLRQQDVSKWMSTKEKGLLTLSRQAGFALHFDLRGKIR